MLDLIKNVFKEWKEFSQIKEDFTVKSRNMALFGLPETIKGLILSLLIQELDKTTVIVTNSMVRAKQLCEELTSYIGDKVYFLPDREVSYHKVAARSTEIIAERIRILELFAKGDKNAVVIGSVEAFLPMQSPLSVFKDNIISISQGDEYDMAELMRMSSSMGYERVGVVEGPGQFAVRGGLFDIYPIADDMPCRLEFFDIEVDLIRNFDPVTQRSTKNIDSVDIMPAREILPSDEDIRNASERIKSEWITHRKKVSKVSVEKSRILDDRIDTLLEIMNEGLYDENFESFFPYLVDDGVSVFDYMPDDTRIIIDQPHRIKEAYDGWREDFEDHFKTLLSNGEVLPGQIEGWLDYQDFISCVNDKKWMVLRTIPGHSKEFEPHVTYQPNIRTAQSYSGRMSILSNDLNDWAAQKYRLLLLAGSDSKSIGLKRGLSDQDIDVNIVEGNKLPNKGRMAIYPHNIICGFELPDIKTVILGSLEIFGHHRKLRRQGQKRRKINPFTDLDVGGYVVHENHGIGRYLGIRTMEVQGAKRDYLTIQYAGKDRLYIPAGQMDIIQPYVGMGGRGPKLSRLGGNDWQRIKSKVQKSIEDLSEELLALYAVREDAKGFAYSVDTVWQQEFEEAFPYEETPDQLDAVKDIKGDMENARVMDRLLCGDVGYGKTEVAIRAAFKATMDSRQTAFLAPTTILAQQHYQTLIRRFENFPVNIEVLSRFRTPAQQKKTIRKLKSGEVDIIVGTHRLFSKDIRFKNLGLLIIDEEQRFGVKHKEAIKQIKKNVDVLTLTATPIPRTLHMSLVGIRDISLIDTPPENRRPVQTYVAEYSDSLVRDAILREIGREGQVYFVYNRVKTMDRMAMQLQELVPEARIGMAHGQMAEVTLERSMMSFYEKEYDVLVCSTIIENGLDVSNANTLIVYDADRLGLSQLYQLRGRVGRSARLAYSYFLYNRDKVITEVAEKRLQTIREFTEFGSGFKIAMRDLEIRGAGNLLGGEQHGHMASVGYDMYCKLLKETVSTMKGIKKPVRVETTIQIQVDAHIDDEYISMESQKMEMYKRISSIESIDDKRDVEDELTDRFGDMDDRVKKLIDVAWLKYVASRLGVKEINHHRKRVDIKFYDSNTVNPKTLMVMLNESRGRITYRGSQNPVFTIHLDDSDADTALTNSSNFIHKINHLQNG